jgi:glycosyltransferase involved in cell wall biosynthesis
MRITTISTSDNSVLISVVMSVHNFDRYPIPGIETTLEQTYTDFEFIVVDDGSNYETKESLYKYASSDNRIKLLTNEKNLKLASSLNRGIREAKGKYIARADVNIEYHQSRLQKQIDFLENHPEIDVVGSNFLWATEGKVKQRYIKLPEKNKEIIKKLSRANCICHPSVMYRKERLIKYGPYKEGFGKPEDYHLWMKTRKDLQFYNMQQSLLLKWHRANPWNDRLFEYFINDFKLRIMGIKTSPNPIIDILFLPKCLNYFFHF